MQTIYLSTFSSISYVNHLSIYPSIYPSTFLLHVLSDETILQIGAAACSSFRFVSLQIIDILDIDR